MVGFPSLQLAPGLRRLPGLRHAHLHRGLILRRPAAARGRVLGAAGPAGRPGRAGCAGPAAGDGIGVVGALQESYDFAPKFLFHRLVHKLEGSLVLHDALLDGHCILLDGRFGALRIHPALPGEFLQGFDAVLVQIQLW